MMNKTFIYKNLTNSIEVDSRYLTNRRAIIDNNKIILQNDKVTVGTNLDYENIRLHSVSLLGSIVDDIDPVTGLYYCREVYLDPSIYILDDTINIIKLQSTETDKYKILVCDVNGDKKWLQIDYNYILNNSIHIDKLYSQLDYTYKILTIDENGSKIWNTIDNNYITNLNITKLIKPTSLINKYLKYNVSTDVNEWGDISKTDISDFAHTHNYSDINDNDTANMLLCFGSDKKTTASKLTNDYITDNTINCTKLAYGSLTQLAILVTTSNPAQQIYSTKNISNYIDTYTIPLNRLEKTNNSTYYGYPLTISGSSPVGEVIQYALLNINKLALPTGTITNNKLIVYDYTDTSIKWMDPDSITNIEYTQINDSTAYRFLYFDSSGKISLKQYVQSVDYDTTNKIILEDKFKIDSTTAKLLKNDTSGVISGTNSINSLVNTMDINITKLTHSETSNLIPLCTYIDGSDNSIISSAALSFLFLKSMNPNYVFHVGYGSGYYFTNFKLNDSCILNVDYIAKNDDEEFIYFNDSVKIDDGKTLNVSDISLNPDSSYNHINCDSIYISGDNTLESWAGFYYGPSSHYSISGQNNNIVCKITGLAMASGWCANSSKKIKTIETYDTKQIYNECENILNNNITTYAIYKRKYDSTQIRYIGPITEKIEQLNNNIITKSSLLDSSYNINNDDDVIYYYKKSDDNYHIIRIDESKKTKDKYYDYLYDGIENIINFNCNCVKHKFKSGLKFQILKIINDDLYCSCTVNDIDNKCKIIITSTDIINIKAIEYNQYFLTYCACTHYIYDKVKILEDENAKLKNRIIELNQQIYDSNNMLKNEIDKLRDEFIKFSIKSISGKSSADIKSMQDLDNIDNNNNNDDVTKIPNDDITFIKIE